MKDPIEYYSNPNVRERIAEYCGGASAEPMSFTAEYLVGYGAYLKASQKKEFVSSDVSGFHWILDHGLDIFRSVWDKESTIAVLDVEYYNLDYPGEIYYDPYACFLKLEPLYQIIQQKLKEWRIPHLTLMTGQGYHFAWKIGADSPADRSLEQLGRVSDSLAEKYEVTTTHRHRRVSLQHGRAFDGLGRVMEYISHDLLRSAGDASPVPLVFSDIVVGPVNDWAREAISIDLSAFGDPITMRDIRCPFSTHQKHKLQVYKVGKQIAREIPIQLSLPRRDELPLYELLKFRRNYDASAEMASVGSCVLPDAANSFYPLIQQYRTSSLAQFHEEFDSVEHDHLKEWSKTYDALNLSKLPPCIALPLARPNPLVLQPTHLQNISRYLYLSGWHPKHIGGLIRSKYERNFRWSEDWTHLDAATRANFWVRLYSGALAVGLDQRTDFNCVSMQERGLCPKPWCGHNLADTGEKNP